MEIELPLKKSIIIAFWVTLVLSTINYILYLYTIGRISPEISNLFAITFSLLIGGPLLLGTFFYFKARRKSKGEQ